MTWDIRDYAYKNEAFAAARYFDRFRILSLASMKSLMPTAWTLRGLGGKQGSTGLIKFMSR